MFCKSRWDVHCTTIEVSDPETDLTWVTDSGCVDRVGDPELRRLRIGDLERRGGDLELRRLRTGELELRRLRTEGQWRLEPDRVYLSFVALLHRPAAANQK